MRSTRTAAYCYVNLLNKNSIIDNHLQIWNRDLLRGTVFQLLYGNWRPLFHIWLPTNRGTSTTARRRYCGVFRDSFAGYKTADLLLT